MVHKIFKIFILCALLFCGPGDVASGCGVAGSFFSEATPFLQPYNSSEKYLMMNRANNPAQKSIGANINRAAGGVSAKANNTGEKGYADIVADTDIFFEFGSSDISDHAENAIAEIAYLIKNTENIANVLIIGHADVIGADVHNKRLSRERAEAVVDRLVSHYSLKRSMFEAKGLGSSRATIKTGSEDDMKRDRRVSVYFKIESGLFLPRINVAVTGFEFDSIDGSRGVPVYHGQIVIEDFRGVQPGDTIQLEPLAGFQIEPETIELKEKGQQQALAVAAPTDLMPGKHNGRIKFHSEKAMVMPQEYSFSIVMPEMPEKGSFLAIIFFVLFLLMLCMLICYLLFLWFNLQVIWVERSEPAMTGKLEVGSLRNTPLDVIDLPDCSIRLGRWPRERSLVFIDIGDGPVKITPDNALIEIVSKEKPVKISVKFQKDRSDPDWFKDDQI